MMLSKKKKVIKLSPEQLLNIYEKYGEDFKGAMTEIPDEQHLEYIDIFFLK